MALFAFSNADGAGVFGGDCFGDEVAVGIIGLADAGVATDPAYKLVVGVVDPGICGGAALVQALGAVVHGVVGVGFGGEGDVAQQYKISRVVYSRATWGENGWEWPWILGFFI
jgi:hypothetical protein